MSDPPLHSPPLDSPPLQRFAREPLLHFLLLGALVYGLYWAVQDPFSDPEGNRITVTSGEIAWLTTAWEKRWGRPPTGAERDGLVREYVRETVMYREALAMGLDRDDTIVRRRLAQKLEFLVQDLLQIPEPSDEQLLLHRQSQSDRYTRPALVTFTHVFVDPDRRGASAATDAEALLAKLRTASDPDAAAANVGDPFLLQRYYPERDTSEISKLFGREFATQVDALEPGSWHGPVLSGYGLHLVFVHAREEAVELPLEEVRDRIVSDWRDDERRRLNEDYYARLVERYEITIEDSPPEELAATPAMRVTP